MLCRFGSSLHGNAFLTLMLWHPGRHGSEHDALEALQMFEGIVKLWLTPADIRAGILPTSMVLRGRATGQRLRSAAETDRPRAKRQ